MLTWTTLDIVNSFLGLVVIARAKHPDPFRTRPLSAVAPMVLRLKTWESRSPPNLVRNENTTVSLNDEKKRIKTSAGWSSPVARQAHNLKVVGSNPTPATNLSCEAPSGALSLFGSTPSAAQLAAIVVSLICDVGLGPAANVRMPAKLP